MQYPPNSCYEQYSSRASQYQLSSTLRLHLTAMASPPATDWDKLGVTFGPIPEYKYNDAVDMFYQHFNADEAVFRSLKLGQPGDERSVFIDR